jgi:hypothetical protein
MMSGRWRNDPDVPARFARERIAQLAGGQQGRITRAQLRRLGVGKSTIGEWTAVHYLHPRLPGVYAVGTAAGTDESKLFEAVLYAGPGAMLSHGTAVHWLGLIDYPPAETHVSTPRRRASLPGVQVHGRRPLERMVHLGIPVTTIAQALLDLAAVSELDPVPVRVALARLDFRHELDVRALAAVCRSGCPGSRLLHWAIANYDPRFARTRSPLENDWIVVCEELDIPKPDDINGFVHGIRSDNIYRDARLIVELDGYGNHRSRAQLRRDHRNDRILRGHRWLVLRYSPDDVHDDAEAVATEVLDELARRSPRPERTPRPQRTPRPERTPRPQRTPRPERAAPPRGPATGDDGETIRTFRPDSP